MTMRIRILASETETATSVGNTTRNTGLYATRNYIPLIARILLAALFLWSGINKILHPTETQQYMAAFGMPFTGFFLFAAIVQELVGALFLLTGYRARLGATILIIFTVVATLIFHTNLSDQMQQIMFLKNLAIIGGLLMVVQYGAGNVALRPRA